MRRGISIRLRLTLLYTAILAVTVIAFSSVLYLAQSRATYSSVESNLVRQAQDFVRHNSFPSHEGDNSPSRPPDLNLPTGTLPGRWTQTRTLTGEVVGRTLDLSAAELPLSPAALTAVQTGNGAFETATVEDQPVMVYSVAYTGQDGQPAIVQSAFPIGQSQQALNALRIILALGSTLTTLLAFVLGWVFAGTALDPIQRITQTARKIGAEHDLSGRVAYSGPTDEVGQLALTFNDMLTELESAYRQLEQSLDSQRRFVADASHELRTPLTTVRGNVELLRRQPPIPADEAREILSDTIEEVERLIRLVNQLLVLARADAGHQLEVEPVPLQPLLEDVCRQSRSLAPESEVACSPSTDGVVLSNRDATKQVLLILLDNAVRHTAPGTPVQISTERQGDRVAVHVADRGPGIPSAMLPHIFERFYRGEVSRSGEGAGLGLAIAKELVEVQGGAISVESRPGEGATFTVTLPAAKG